MALYFEQCAEHLLAFEQVPEEVGQTWFPNPITGEAFPIGCVLVYNETYHREECQNVILRVLDSSNSKRDRKAMVDAWRTILKHGRYLTYRKDCA